MSPMSLCKAWQTYRYNDISRSRPSVRKKFLPHARKSLSCFYQTWNGLWFLQNKFDLTPCLFGHLARGQNKCPWTLQNVRGSTQENKRFRLWGQSDFFECNKFDLLKASLVLWMIGFFRVFRKWRVYVWSLSSGWYKIIFSPQKSLRDAQ